MLYMKLHEEYTSLLEIKKDVNNDQTDINTSKNAINKDKQLKSKKPVAIKKTAEDSLESDLNSIDTDTPNKTPVTSNEDSIESDLNKVDNNDIDKSTDSNNVDSTAGEESIESDLNNTSTEDGNAEYSDPSDDMNTNAEDSISSDLHNDFNTTPDMIKVKIAKGKYLLDTPEDKDYLFERFVDFQNSFDAMLTILKQTKNKYPSLVIEGTNKTIDDIISITGTIKAGLISFNFSTKKTTKNIKELYLLYTKYMNVIQTIKTTIKVILRQITLNDPDYKDKKK